MAKKRTINELRQTKDSFYTNPGAHMSKEGREYLETEEEINMQVKDLESKEAELMLEQQELQNVYGKWANTVNNSEEMQENRKFKNIAGDHDLIQAAKEQIINQLQDDFYDVIFQAVADKMNENYMFRENNYFTEAGMDEFEDAWFEWYHNHHGDILTAVLKNLGH